MEQLTDKQLKRIAKLISKHLGKTNPIQVKEIGEHITLTEREIRKAVQTLVNEQGFAIGSTTKHPSGYYIIVKPDDLEEAIKNLSNREQKIAERIKRLVDNAQSEGVKIKNYKKKIIDKSTTINIENLILINLPDES
jgi:predicted transcriptional regulator